MEYKPKFTNAPTTKQHRNANQRYLSPEISSQASPNGPKQAIVNATPMAAQLSSTCVHISWENVVNRAHSHTGGFSKKWRKKLRFKRALNTQKSCNFSSPGSSLILELIALFRSTVHNTTCKGTKTDAPHWVGEFGPGPGPTIVKAHV